MEEEQKQDYREHLINTIDMLIDSGISVYDLDVVNKKAIRYNYVLKQKVNKIVTEIQEEFNKLDKETDKQIKDKNKDYYKCKENIAIMQTLAYCRDKLEELLEEK